MTANPLVTRTAEHVGEGHPDKFADQVSDAFQDGAYDAAIRLGHPPSSVRTAIEVLCKADLVIVSGEARAPDGVLAQVDVDAIVRALRADLRYPHRDDLRVINHVHPQAAEIASITGDDGAGDQGIMVGYASRDTDSYMPLEYELARRLLMRLSELSRNGTLPKIGSDTKSQVSVRPDGSFASVIVSAQHAADYPLEALREDIFSHVVVPVLGDVPRAIVRINHRGSFVEGGSDADAGVTGRKIVIDGYGPFAAPVGGGAFSGKDPTKVDRSGAYQARQIARTILEDGFADGAECHVTLAYGIGQRQPEAVTAVVDRRHDVTDWVLERFPDLSPRAIQERLGLWDRAGWTYRQTAAFGHFGRNLPWEARHR
jgi:S-adenosylmethionine synthetase